jgi:hypothetical protein
MTPVMLHTSLAFLLWRSRSCSSRITPIAADARALRCPLSPSPRRRGSRPQQGSCCEPVVGSNRTRQLFFKRK